MSVIVRAADLSGDAPAITGALRQFMGQHADARRFEWLYTQCPFGAGRAWLAHNETEVIGLAAAFPRQMYTAAGNRLGWVLGDFCVSPKQRSMGVALQLQRACLAALDPALWYDFPSQAMLAVYKRIGIAPTHTFVRLAKPLRCNGRIRRVLGNRMAAVLSPPVNAVLRARDWRFRGASPFTVALQQGPCGEEFTRLAGKVGTRYGTCVQRSAEYLNWRYLAHPGSRYEILTARRQGELCGYIIFTPDGEEIRIAELFGRMEAPLLECLLAGLLQIARERTAASVNAPLLDCHVALPLLRQLGFHARESVPAVVGGMDQDAHSQWFLMEGDRES